MSVAVILTVLLRRWRVVVVSAALGALVGFVLTTLIPTRYSATTTLVVSPLVTNPFSNSREEVNIRTEREILGSREVARRASELLGGSLESDSYLISHVDVAAPSGSQILQVAVHASTPDQAAAAADAISQAYLEFRREGADEVAARYIERIDEQLADLASQPDTAATSALLESLQQQRVTVQLSTAEPGRIIGAAVVPSAPSTPSETVMIGACTVLGLLIGCALAFVRERTDRRVASVDRLQRAVHVPIVRARSLGDPEAWEEVAHAVEEANEIDGRDNQRILIDSFGWTKDAAVGIEAQTRLAAALAGDPLTDSDADEIPREQFRWVPIANHVRFSYADMTAETSRARVTRIARACDMAVLLVSPHAELEEVDVAVSQTRSAGADPVIVFTGNRWQPNGRRPIIDLSRWRAGEDGE